MTCLQTPQAAPAIYQTHQKCANIYTKQSGCVSKKRGQNIAKILEELLYQEKTAKFEATVIGCVDPIVFVF